MLLGYVLPDSRHPAAPQQKALIDFGVAKGKIWTEADRKKGADYPEFEHLTGEHSGVARQKDSAVVVRDAHRLASNRDDWRRHLELIHKRGGHLVEARTGRKSQDALALLAMWIETVAYFDGGKMSKEAASRIGKKGADASSATKAHKGRMPFDQVQKIVDANPTMTYAEICEVINSNRAYKKPWHVATLMYWRGKRLNLGQRKAGRRLQAPR